VLLAALVSGAAQARPVTFAEGVAASAESRGGSEELTAAYSFNALLAAGLDVGRWGDENVAFATLAALPLKWNAAGARGNLYLTAGAGAVGSRPGYLTQADADVESLTLYASARYERLWPDRHIYSRVRAGFAPFVAPMDGLQIWMLLQWSHAAVGPVLRFMYKTALWELGADRRSTTLSWTVEQ
jgi:hypothetical protein